MTKPDTDGVLRGLAERLLTLRVTVVLSQDLGRRPTGLDDASIRTTLHETWSRYLTDAEAALAPRDRALDSIAASRGDARARALAQPEAAASPKPGTPAGFEALAARAHAVYGRLPDRSAPLPEDEPPPKPIDPGVVRRISALCEALSRTPSDDVGRVSEQLLLANAEALGTDSVLLETTISLAGDVTTRVDRAWLASADPARVQSVLELQRMGMHASISWWSGLVELLGRVGGTLVDLVLRR